MKRLFLLDAYALIFRGYYAFIKNPRINSKGLDTSAVMGFMNSLLDVINREKPEYLAVAFDNGGSQIRNEMYPQYKANRDETPEAIRIAVPYIKEILKAMHIPVVEVPGIEADDLIGTLSKQAEKEGFKVYMVTPDKDFAQLVSDNIFMYRPARMGNGIEIWGVDQVKEKFEIEHPLQVIDFLGMMGDAIDNIPGLPGVGEKTAKKLLAEFGSMEGLLANTDKLKGALKQKVEANKEQGMLSKKLATILLDCPVEFNEEKFELETPDYEKVAELFNELEFRRMVEQFQKIFSNNSDTKVVGDVRNETDKTTTSKKKPQDENQTSLFGNDGQADLFSQAADSLFENIETTPHFYQITQGDLGIRLLVENLCNQKSVCFDTETTGLDALSATLVGIAF